MRYLMKLVLAPAIVAATWIADAGAQGVPDPANWTFPPSVMLVGQSGGAADPRGAFIVVIRDLAMNPMPNVSVDVEFNQALDVRLATVADPGMTVLCPFHVVRAVTDQAGIARFAIRGGSRIGPATSYTATVRFYADGILGATRPVSTPDLDGINGVGAGDLAMFLEDFFTQQNPLRSDFNHDGILGGADLGMWIDIFAAGGSAVSDPTCP